MNITESSFTLKKDMAPKDYWKLRRKVSCLPGVIKCHKNKNYHSIYITYDTELCPEEEINAVLSTAQQCDKAIMGLFISLLLSFFLSFFIYMVI